MFKSSSVYERGWSTLSNPVKPKGLLRRCDHKPTILLSIIFLEIKKPPRRIKMQLRL